MSTTSRSASASRDPRLPQRAWPSSSTSSKASPETAMATGRSSTRSPDPNGSASSPCSRSSDLRHAARRTGPHRRRVPRWSALPQTLRSDETAIDGRPRFAPTVAWAELGRGDGSDGDAVAGHPTRSRHRLDRRLAAPAWCAWRPSRRPVLSVRSRRRTASRQRQIGAGRPRTSRATRC